MVATQELTPAEAIALSKIETKGHREELETGNIAVDFKVRCTGELLVQEDYQQLYIGPGDIYRLLAHVLARPWCKTDIDALVAKVFPDAAVFEATDGPAQDLAKKVRQLLDPIKPKSVCRGSVRSNLTYRRLK